LIIQQKSYRKSIYRDFPSQSVEVVCSSVNTPTPPKPPLGNVSIQSITPLPTPDRAISSLLRD